MDCHVLARLRSTGYGLILCEALTNAMKYAHPSRRAGAHLMHSLRSAADGMLQVLVSV